MKPKGYHPEDDSLLTRQVEMLMQGYSMEGAPGTVSPAGESPKAKRRTLDDMRRLSEHIKNVPIYTKK